MKTTLKNGQHEWDFETNALPPQDKIKIKYKCAFYFKGQEKPSFNSLRFDTIEGAKAHGNDLLNRWCVPTHFEVVESIEEKK